MKKNIYNKIHAYTYSMSTWTHVSTTETLFGATKMPGKPYSV